jgi:hypothetical protein
MLARHGESDHTHRDNEAVVWLMILILLAAAVYATVALFAKVAG